MLSFQFLSFDEMQSNYRLIKAEEFQHYHGSTGKAPKFLINAYQFMDDLFAVIQHSFISTSCSSQLSENVSLNLSKIIVGAIKLVSKLEGLKHSVFNTNINKMINATERNLLDKRSALEATKAFREFILKNNISYLRSFKRPEYLKFDAFNALEKFKTNSSFQVQADKIKLSKRTLSDAESCFDEIINREFSKTKEFVLPCDVPQKAT